jgi:hypothetical protein
MPAGRSEAGYRKELLEDMKMTGQPREDASTTRMSYRVSVCYLADQAERMRYRLSQSRLSRPLLGKKSRDWGVRYSQEGFRIKD